MCTEELYPYPLWERMSLRNLGNSLCRRCNNKDMKKHWILIEIHITKEYFTYDEYFSAIPKANTTVLSSVRCYFNQSLSHGRMHMVVVQIFDRCRLCYCGIIKEMQAAFANAFSIDTRSLYMESFHCFNRIIIIIGQCEYHDSINKLK